MAVCLVFGVFNHQPLGEQQLIDFQIFKERVDFIHTTNAQHIFCKLKVLEFVDLKLRHYHRDDVSFFKALAKKCRGSVKICRLRNGVSGFRQTCVECLVVEFLSVELHSSGCLHSCLNL